MNPPPDPIGLITQGLFSADAAPRRAARKALGAHPEPRVSAYLIGRELQRASRAKHPPVYSFMAVSTPPDSP